MDNHRTAWSTPRNHGRPQGLCAKGFVQFMGGAAHLMVPKTPIPLKDQPLTSAAGAIRATPNLCMDEEGLRRCWAVDHRPPAYGNSNREGEVLWELSSL